MNKIILIGNLTKDPEIATTNSGIQVARFSVAVQRSIKVENGEDVDFFNIVAWRQLADLCGKYLKKGKRAAIVGSVQNRTYDAKDGTKRYITEVIAESVEFLSPKDAEAKQDTPQGDDSIPS